MLISSNALHSVEENNFLSGAIVRFAGAQDGFTFSEADALNAPRNYYRSRTGPSGDGPGNGVPVITEREQDDQTLIDFRPFYIDADRQVLSTDVGVGSASVEDGSAQVELDTDNDRVRKVRVTPPSGVGMITIVHSSSPIGNTPGDLPNAANPVTFLDIEPDSDVGGSATITVNVSRIAVDDRNRISIFHFVDGQWEELDTTVTDVGPAEIQFEATAFSLSPFAVATTEPADTGDETPTPTPTATPDTSGTFDTGGGFGGVGLPPSTVTETPTDTSTTTETPTDTSTTTETPTDTSTTTETPTDTSTTTETPTDTPTTTETPTDTSTVTGAPTDTSTVTGAPTDPPTTTGATGPGFGAVVAVVAVLATVLLARRTD